MSVSTLLSSLTTAHGAYFFFLLLVAPCIDSYLTDRHYTSSSYRLRTYRSFIALLVLYSLVGYAVHDYHTIVHASSAVQKQAGWHELYGGWLYTAVVALTVASSLPSMYVWYRCCVDQPYRATHLPQLRPLRYLLPVTTLERSWYAALSLTAGLCEEFIYRLLLLHWLSAHMSVGAAVLVGGVVFGCAHWYQGSAGVLRAGVAGVLFGVSYVLFGSWCVVAVLHVVADLQVLVLYRPMLDVPEEAKKLVTGCKLEVE